MVSIGCILGAPATNWVGLALISTARITSISYLYMLFPVCSLGVGFWPWRLALQPAREGV